VWNVTKTALVVGGNAALIVLCPPAGIATTVATIAIAAETSINNRQAQYRQATNYEGELTKSDLAIAAVGDVTGASALYTAVSGEDPVTGQAVSGADRVEAGAHLVVGLAAAHGGAKGGEYVHGRFGAGTTPQTKAANGDSGQDVSPEPQMSRVGRLKNLTARQAQQRAEAAGFKDTGKSYPGKDGSKSQIFKHPQTGEEVVISPKGDITAPLGKSGAGPHAHKLGPRGTPNRPLSDVGERIAPPGPGVSPRATEAAHIPLRPSVRQGPPMPPQVVPPEDE
jgi:hypothetical protein